MAYYYLIVITHAVRVFDTAAAARALLFST